MQVQYDTVVQNKINSFNDFKLKLVPVGVSGKAHLYYFAA